MTLSNLVGSRGAGCGHRRSVKSWVETDPPALASRGCLALCRRADAGTSWGGPRASRSQGPGASVERREGRVGNRDPRPRWGLRGWGEEARRAAGELSTEMRLSMLSEVGWAGQTLCVCVCVCVSERVRVCVCVCVCARSPGLGTAHGSCRARPLLALGTQRTRSDHSMCPPERPCPQKWPAC